ncbi:MAG: N-acetylmuramoyl-L-alanine amidase [Planktomarina sp.]
MPAKWAGDKITPEIVVIHDTTGHLQKGNAVRYFQNNSAKVSTHFVIEQDGSVVQMVPTNRRANHAGKSSYHGRSGCNAFSIGIELVNPGKMTRQGNKGLTWYGEGFDIASRGLLEARTPEHGHGLWMPYTSEQLDAVISLMADLFDYIPTLKDIVPHWYVSPGRKIDTNPLFPLGHVKARVMGRDDPLEAQVHGESEDCANEGEFVTVDTPAASLNLRAAPFTNPNIIADIAHGVVLPVLRRGVFGGLPWLQVLHGGRLGWVMEAFTAAQGRRSK